MFNGRAIRRRESINDNENGYVRLALGEVTRCLDEDENMGGMSVAWSIIIRTGWLQRRIYYMNGSGEHDEVKVFFLRSAKPLQPGSDSER